MKKLRAFATAVLVGAPITACDDADATGGVPPGRIRDYAKYSCSSEVAGIIIYDARFSASAYHALGYDLPALQEMVAMFEKMQQATDAERQAIRDTHPAHAEAFAALDREAYVFTRQPSFNWQLQADKVGSLCETWSERAEHQRRFTVG